MVSYNCSTCGGEMCEVDHKIPAVIDNLYATCHWHEYEVWPYKVTLGSQGGGDYQEYVFSGSQTPQPPQEA